MKIEQQKLNKKVRALLAKASKEKDLGTLHGLLPIFQDIIYKLADPVEHSRFYWEDLELLLDKEYKKQRYIVREQIKKVPTPISEELIKEIDDLVETTKKMVDQVAKDTKTTLIKRPKKTQS